MNTPDTATGGAVSSPEITEERNYINHSQGMLSWLLTLDHKRIGVMYLAAILLAFFGGGLAALVVRTELFYGDGDLLLSGDWYNKFFTLHGAIMVFLVIIPGIPAALGNVVLPILLGAKDVAFPRVNLMSFYFWMLGAACLILSLLLGGIDTGWTFYAPYSIYDAAADSHTAGAVISALTGAFMLGFSSIFTGLNFIVTIHKLRPPGMTWFRMPLFLWSIYATAVCQILATPVLAITLLLLIVENAVGIGIFNPNMGGDPVLMQHFFWFYSHPAVYIMILPAMGVVSELIAVHSHRHIFGYKFIAFSSIAIAIFGFLVWGHHMFTSMSPMMNVIFSALTYSVSIPSAVKVFNWLATMYKGSININTPMLYGMGFIFLFTIAGLTGLPLATLAVDIHLHDTYFVVAHFHYTMMGSALIAFIGGIHHWWPKISGRMYNENMGRVAFFILFFGFNLTFIPQFIAGSRGMPRRYHDYPDIFDFQILHQASTIGAYTMLVSFLMIAYYLVMSLVNGRKAPWNPWGGNSLEWHCQSPPLHENFRETPTVGDCYDYSGLVWNAEIQGYVSKKA
ncbi:MAG: cbb3-type cytochrome c oxidase subunit I [Planctomycetota bacterium]